MKPQQNEYQSLAFHPYNIFLFLLLFGLCAMFFALTVAYTYTRMQSNIPPVKLPIIFLFNTLILVGSSYTMYLSRQCYLKDDTKGYQKMLLYTVILSFIFLGAQVVGWSQLLDNQVKISSNVMGSYLWLISMLHFVHVVAGLPFLCWFLYVAYQRMKEPVSVLVYFSDPTKRLNLRLITIYWNFLDILWIYLVVFFGVNYLMS
jgi:cytochrome c oxidase subunit III